MLLNTIWKVVLFYYLLSIYTIVCQQTCSKDCSTLSKYVNDSSMKDFIPCSVETSACPYKTADDPTKPEFKEKGWYVYDDPLDKMFQKIGLYVLWSPSDESSISETQNYKLTLIDSNSQVQAEVYYCLQKQLTFNENALADFSYGCFGVTDNVDIFPGQTWKITIKNFPTPINYPEEKVLHLSIPIPKCHDSGLKNVSRCFHENTSYLSMSNQSCTSHYVIISYNISSYFGSAAEIWLSKLHNLTYVVKVVENLPLIGNYKVVLPKEFDLSDKYQIQVKGNVISDFSKTLRFDLSHCPSLANQSLVVTLTVVILSIFLLTLFLLFLVVLRKRKRKFVPKEHERFVAQNKNDQQLKFMSNKTDEQLSVYIVFVDDHPLHKEIVSLFATFLMCDLGFNVISELYQTKEICEDLAGWMERSLQQSDKVIVVWSPKAFKRWQLHKNNNEIDDKNDVFTPVIKRIQKDLFRDKNRLKYYFAYFDYCSKENIPYEFIREYSLPPFRLMNQIEELYFRLQGIEMYSSGAVIKQEKADFQKYSDPSINKYGHVLQSRIVEMCEHVKEDPLWYNFQQNSSDTVEYNALIHDADINCVIKKNCLSIIPPFTTPDSTSSAVQLKSDGDVNEISALTSDVAVSSTEVSNDYYDSSVNNYETVSNASQFDESAEVSCLLVPVKITENWKSDDQCNREFGSSELYSTDSKVCVKTEKESRVPNCSKSDEIDIRSNSWSATLNNENELGTHDHRPPDSIILQCDKLQVRDQSTHSDSAEGRNILLKRDDEELQVVLPLVTLEVNSDPMQSLVLINQKSGNML